MQTKQLSEHEKTAFNEVFDYIDNFSKQHPCAVGGLEIAAGAGLIALGIKLGHIAMGHNAVMGVDIGDFNLESLTGAIGGSGLALTAKAVIGGMGLVAAGSGWAVPAALVGAIGGVVGYAGGDLLHNFLNPGLDVVQVVGAGSLLAVGTALVIDGCQRILGSEFVAELWSSLRNGVLHLVEITKQVVAESMEAASDFWGRLTRNITSAPTCVPDTAGTSATTVVAAAGGLLIRY